MIPTSSIPISPIPASVIIVTKNEAGKIADCLHHVAAFDDIWVVDSASRDATAQIAKDHGAHIVSFVWNGQYPKKRQWCLDTLPLKHDWVLFVDADEIVTPDLVDEIAHVLKEQLLDASPQMAGYFITGRYVMQGKVLKYGIPNCKIALIHRQRMEFPVVDDLDIPGMGEIEGHYQPVFTSGQDLYPIGLLRAYMIHDAVDDSRAWGFRHEKYARWESGLNKKKAWPVDPVPWRQAVKTYLRQSRFRPEGFFVLGFLVKLGFLDGWRGWRLARMKYTYYALIRDLMTGS